MQGDWRTFTRRVALGTAVSGGEEAHLHYQGGQARSLCRSVTI